MISKLISASHSVKVLGDLIKAATELKNYNEFVAAVSEVNAKLMQTQSAGLLAQEKQSSLSDPVAELEKDIRGLKHGTLRPIATSFPKSLRAFMPYAGSQAWSAASLSTCFVHTVRAKIEIDPPA
jgi:hypothetical protein